MKVKSDIFERIERLFSEGEITEEGLDKAIIKGWITEADKYEILRGGVNGI